MKNGVVLFVILVLVSSSLIVTHAQDGTLTETFDTPDLPGWELSPGAAVSDGVLRIMGPEGNASVFNTWGDLSLSMRTRQTGDGALAVSYRITDAGTYTLVFGHDFMALDRGGAGGPVGLGTASVTIPDWEWVQIDLNVLGGLHVVRLNGQVVLSATDDDPLPAGGIMFVAFGGKMGEFDDVTIKVGEAADMPAIPAPTVAPTVEPPPVAGDDPAYLAESWVRLYGPPGGLGYDIRMDPRNPDVMFVTASPGGIFKSVDGGMNWTAKNQGIEPFPGAGANIFCATIDPHNPDHVWVGTQFNGRVYRSTDGGETWQARDNGITQMPGENSIRGITIDPNDQNVVYIGMERGTGAGGVTGEVYKSTDGGENFTMIWQGDNLARYVWVDPRNSQRLYVSTGIFDRGAFNGDPENMVCGGVGIVRSDDGGQTWTVLDERNGLGGTYIPSLYMHPTNPDVLIAAVEPQDYCPDFIPGVYVTRDGGDTWTVSLFAPVIAVEISETNPDIWYAASAQTQFWRSEDGGQTWHEYPLRTAYRPAGFPIDLQADPRDPMRIFDNNYEGGNLLSEDGGATWVEASSGYSGAQTGGVAVAPGDGATVLAGAGTATWRSTDGGVHWNGTGIEQSVVTILRYTAPDGRRRLIATGGLYGSVLLFSDDGGQTWVEHEVVTWGEAAAATWRTGARALAVAPSDPQVMYIGYSLMSCLIGDWPFCTQPALLGFFRSRDGGVTWEHVTGTPFEEASILDAAVAIDDPQTVYVTTHRGLFVSHDGGDSWQALSTIEQYVEWRDMGGVQIPPAVHIVTDPFNAHTLYVGTEFSGLWVSTDDGASWTQAVAGMEPNDTIIDILPDPNRPGVIYVSTAQSGVCVSLDGGVTWQKLDQGADFRGLSGLALSEDGSVLYAGSGGGGVFRLGTP